MKLQSIFVNDMLMQSEEFIKKTPQDHAQQNTKYPTGIPSVIICRNPRKKTDGNKFIPRTYTDNPMLKIFRVLHVQATTNSGICHS